jgi:hypothetical protein
MTAFLLRFGWNWLLIPVAIWFANGLRKVITIPRIQYVSHAKVGANYLVTVKRQSLLPPWSRPTETWHVIQYDYSYDTIVTREGDGLIYNNVSVLDFGLFNRLRGALRVGIARDLETEELSK